MRTLSTAPTTPNLEDRSPGTMCDASGELFFKPCTQAEINWYQTVSWRYQDFADIMPLFMGTMNLTELPNLDSIENGVGPIAVAATVQEPEVKDNFTWKPSNGKIKTDLAIVLENASYGFKQPNILDVKLGVRLWADDAPQQKKERFDKIRDETTHLNFGFRIAGMRVYRGSENDDELDEDGYKVYDKDYGRVSVSDDNVAEALRSFVFNEAAGIDEDLGKAVCAAFARDIAHVEHVLSRNETRMYSSSLLFVFEGDGDALRAAVDEHNSIADALIERAPEGKPTRTAARVDSGIGMEDDDFDSEAEFSSVPRVYSLKLIDFAHARFLTDKDRERGESGPDENCLKGVRSLQRIFTELSQ